MALFTLSKLYHPDFSTPNKKPLQPVAIDRLEPLTRGLMVCLIFQRGRIFDLITGNEVTESAAGLFRKPDGNVFTTANDTAFIDLDLTSIDLDISELTISTNIKSAGNNSFDDFWSIDIGGSLVVLESRGDGADEYTPAIFGVGDSIPGFTEVQNAGNQQGELPNITTYSISTNANLGFLRVNNDIINSTVTHSASGGIDAIRILNRIGATNRGVRAELEFFMVWDRALTVAEDNYLKRNYKAVLKPVTPPVYFTAAAVVGINIPVIMNHLRNQGIS